MQKWLAAVPPTMYTFLPLKSVVQLLSDAVAQSYSLQQHTVFSGLLLEGIKWLVLCGSSIPSRLPFSCFLLPVCLVGLAGCNTPSSCLYLPQTGRQVPGHPRTPSGPLGCRISSLVASYSHMAGYPVEPHLPPMGGKALEAAQDSGDEAHIVFWVWLLEGLQPCPGVCMQHNCSLLTVFGVLQGQLDGHQLCLQGGAVVGSSLTQLCPANDGSSTCPPTVRVN